MDAILRCYLIALRIEGHGSSSAFLQLRDEIMGWYCQEHRRKRAGKDDVSGAARRSIRPPRAWFIDSYAAVNTTSRGRTLMSGSQFPRRWGPLLPPVAAVPGATQDRDYRGPPADRMASCRASPHLSSSSRLTRPPIHSWVVPNPRSLPRRSCFFVFFRDAPGGFLPILFVSRGDSSGISDKPAGAPRSHRSSSQEALWTTSASRHS